MYLDLNQHIDYIFGDHKRFAKNEFHVTRTANYDVLILMLDGVLHFTEQGEEISLARGEYYIQQNGLTQSATLPSDNAHYIYLHFNGHWTDVKAYGLYKRGHFDIEKIYPIADRLCVASRTPNLPLTALNGRFYQITELLQGNGDMDSDTLIAQKIYKYISEHYFQDISVSSLSKQFSYSPDYVIRVFKRAYGTTPHKHLTYCRIEYAKALLSATERSVTDIAASCGYSDFSSFFRAFRAYTSLSPTDWRSSKRK